MALNDSSVFAQLDEAVKEQTIEEEDVKSKDTLKDTDKMSSFLFKEDSTQSSTQNTTQGNTQGTTQSSTQDTTQDDVQSLASQQRNFFDNLDFVEEKNNTRDKATEMEVKNNFGDTHATGERILQPVGVENPVIKSDKQLKEEPAFSLRKPSITDDNKKENIFEKRARKVTKKQTFQIYETKASSKFSLAGDVAKYTLLERRFKNKGRLILAVGQDGKPIMQLYQVGNELMAYKYLGSSLEVVIPAYVGNIPVRYVYRNMFTKHFDFIDRNGLRNVKEQFFSSDILNMNKASLSESMNGIKRVVFPNTIVELPANLFYKCFQITEVVLPKSLRNISLRCFNGSGIKSIYFNGTPPEELRSCSFPRNVMIYIAK